MHLNRSHGEEIEVELVPVVPENVWDQGRKGVYAVMEHAIDVFGPRYEKDPRVLAVGPAARYSDFGAVGSAPVKKGMLTHVDTWAGRGGFGSKLFQEHVFWESERNTDMVSTFLKNKKEIDGVSHPELDHWADFFTRDKHAAAYEFWYEMHKGIHEMLREYPV